MTPIPNVVGMIERRLLVNYRVAPDVLARLLPDPFRPHLVGGVGVAGICLIRLGQLRPAGVPPWLGLTSENAAHRVAVEWDGPEGVLGGVYVPRRDTSSRLATVVGGRLFPGEHYRARFRVHEDDGRYEVAFTSVDGSAQVEVVARTVTDLPDGSVFSSMADASTFFREGSLGYSATRRPGRFDGLELRCATWAMEPLEVEAAESSFFGDGHCFPPGSVELDSALLMGGIPVTWKRRRPLGSARSATVTGGPTCA
jgi:uncharacterized protein YqjF (DUF2071 family)